MPMVYEQSAARQALDKPLVCPAEATKKAVGEAARTLEGA
jgi:hypothetical protein